jgi:hypothetical protein
MRHVMLDLETWGLTPGCAIRSIGAVGFDPYTDQTFGSLYYNIQDESCFEVGLQKDQSTTEWWSKQHIDAQKVLLLDPIPLMVALKSFSLWYVDYQYEAIWSHGEAFDLPVLEAAYRAVHITPAWDYRVGRDTRTLYMLADFDVRSIPFKGQPHNALHDARQQTLCVQRAVEIIEMWKLDAGWIRAGME